MSAEREALRQCAEVLKLVDFADCAEKEELWHKLNAAQQVVEEVLKRPEQEPVAYIVYAEDGGVMVPQFPAYAAKSLADRCAALYGQTPTEVRPLYAAPIASQKAVAAVPEGWQLVPKDLTAEMESAADDVSDIGMEHDSDLGSQGWVNNISEMYTAMLAAAPQPANFFLAPLGEVNKNG